MDPYGPDKELLVDAHVLDGNTEFFGLIMNQSWTETGAGIPRMGCYLMDFGLTIRMPHGITTPCIAKCPHFPFVN
jgi:hypothetical protein